MTFGRLIVSVILTIIFFKTLQEVNEYPDALKGFVAAYLVIMALCIICLIIPADCLTEIIALFKDVFSRKIF